MAKSKKVMFILSMTLTFVFSLAAAKHPPFHRSISPSSLGLGEEKLTHFHFYFHDILSGPNPTAVPVAQAQITNSSSTFFGLLLIADDPLTVGPELGSKLVGRSQGLFGFVDQDDEVLVMIFTFVFTEGKYNGSTLTMVGRNMILSTGLREMPIVGGSGAFRFARGYALAKTYSADMTTGDAVVEYNIYVFHY